MANFDQNSEHRLYKSTRDADGEEVENQCLAT